MSYVFILNPSANRTRAKRAEDWLRDCIAIYWPGSQIVLTTSKNDIGRVVSEAASSNSVIIACGGDGTVNETFSRVVDILPDYPSLAVGVLPMGSGNDFAKSIGLSTNRYKAIEQLRTAQIESIDYVEYETNQGSGYMFNTLNMGLGGQINVEAAKVQRLKGPLIYVYSALKSLLKVAKCSIRLNLDGNVTSEAMVMLTVANGGVEGGNFRVAPAASNTDGMLDLVTIKPLPVIFLLPLLPLFLVAKQHWYRNTVVFRRFETLFVESDLPVALHVDGEQCGLEVKSLMVTLKKHGLRVLKPVDRV
jgi:diacylglycerol kinase (ATP)